ncbi:MAG: CvpA family protein [Bacteroidetes bacterium]|nr:CvpA family protein [Bacteroidota bacterium]
MNYIDIVLCVPILWGLYQGMSKGLIIEAASIVALGLAVWGAIKFSDFFAKYIQEHASLNTKYLPMISFAMIFLVTLVLVYAIAKFLERLVKAVSLGFLNKLAGGIFGMLKFGLILSIVIFILNAIEKNIQLIPAEAKQKSLLYEPVGKIAPLIIPGLKESKLGKSAPY